MSYVNIECKNDDLCIQRYGPGARCMNNVCIKPKELDKFFKGQDPELLKLIGGFIQLLFLLSYF